MHGGPSVSIFEERRTEVGKVFNRIPEIDVSVRLSDLLDELRQAKCVEGCDWTTLTVVLGPTGKFEFDFASREMSNLTALRSEWRQCYLRELEFVPDNPSK